MDAARILIIEKDTMLKARVGAALEGAGYIVVMAENGSDAARELVEANPDIIIMERKLPQMPGDEPSLRILQEAYMPVIILGEEDEAAELLDMGADAYMMKPPNMAELVARVRSLLGRSRGH